MDLLNNNDMPNEGESPSIDKTEDLSPSDILTSDEELELKEKLKKLCEKREITKDDMLKIMQDTHRILSEEIITLKNELRQKLETSTLNMNKVGSTSESSAKVEEIEKNLDNRIQTSR